MANLNEFAMAKLAREMAINIRNYKDIFADFGITEEEYYEICKLDFFKRCKEQFALEWNSAMSAADRVKLTSATAAEELLSVVTRRALDPHEPLINVLGTFKQVCQNAGIGDPKAEQKPNERFVITINLGADTETFNKSVAIDANDIDLSAKKDTTLKLVE